MAVISGRSGVGYFLVSPLLTVVCVCLFCSHSEVLPTVPPNITCSPNGGQYVAEDQIIECTCTAPDLGYPEGQLLGYRDEALVARGLHGDDLLTLPLQVLGRNDSKVIIRCVLYSEWARLTDRETDTSLSFKVACK